MSAQIIYVARHGLTEGNIAQVVQGFDDPLSEQGHRQAVRLAERAKHLKFDHLMASDMVRSQETAHYIAEATGKSVIVEPLIREVIRPTSYWGMPHHSEQYQQMLKDERANFHDPNWRIEDGENFDDIRKRALSTLDRFEEFGDQTLFVISHGHFIRVLVATVMMERALTPEVWAHATRTIRNHNTGITILRRDLDHNHWAITSVNDHAHFADD